MEVLKEQDIHGHTLLPDLRLSQANRNSQVDTVLAPGDKANPEESKGKSSPMMEFRLQTGMQEQSADPEHGDLRRLTVMRSMATLEPVPALLEASCLMCPRGHM